jgi:hypothetical protein
MFFPHLQVFVACKNALNRLNQHLRAWIKGRALPCSLLANTEANKAM